MALRADQTLVEPAFLDDAAVSKFMCIGRSTVWKWTSSGKLPAPIRIGKRTLWDREELEAHVRSLRAAA